MRNGRLAVLGAMMWMSLVLTAPAAAQAPPDVVELRNGGMVRGTLVENIPGDHVTIQIATGELRTFPSAEVLRVGPAPVAPVMTPVVVEPGYPTGVAVPAPPAPMINVRVVGTSEELSLHRLTGTASVSVWTGRGVGTAAIDQFAIICGAPCDQQLPAGTYTLGVSQGNGMARRADHSIFHLDHDATLELEYESREGVRIGGWLSVAVWNLVAIPACGGRVLCRCLVRGSRLIASGFRTRSRFRSRLGSRTDRVLSRRQTAEQQNQHTRQESRPERSSCRVAAQHGQMTREMCGQSGNGSSF